MRRSHFQHFQPVCPHCSGGPDGPSPLVLAQEIEADAEGVEQGLLHCANPACQLEYPIIDGIPIIVPDVRGVLARQLAAIQAREDLPGPIESLLGDAAGQASEFDSRRQHLSIYGWDGYAAQIAEGDPQADEAGSVLRCLRLGCDLLAGEGRTGPILDLGCSIGRTTFELASRSGAPTLGIDLNYSMLRFAQRLRRDGRARLPRRREGVVYDDCTVRAEFDHSDAVDFWLCDAMALPFTAQRFATIVALNLLDCVPSPIALLQALEHNLMAGGEALLATPFDWASGATPMEAWIGGHSQRGAGNGDSAALLRRLLTRGAHPQSLTALEITAEQAAVPWRTRLHARSTMHYESHLFALRRQGG